jgi:2-dehydropantoate 2-reductase
MRVAVIGAGGVGGYFGGRLARGGIDVTFLVRGKTLEALRTRGLRVESIHGDFTLDHLKATDDPASVGPVDAVLVAVKAWQIAEAVANIGPMIGPETVVIPLENGMTAPEEIARIVGPDHALGGLCGIVSYVVAPGHIRHQAVDPFVMFGELDHSPSDRVERLRQSFEQAGVHAEVPPDIHRSMWTKFVFVVPYGAIGSLTRLPLGAWLSIPETRALVVSAIRELLAVAAARGVTLAPDVIDQTLARYERLPGDSTTSLQRDIMEGKPSELEAQIGDVVRMAHQSAVPAPLFEAFYALLLPQEQRARVTTSAQPR